MTPLFWNRLGLAALGIWLAALLLEQLAGRRGAHLTLIDAYSGNGKPADDLEEAPVP